MLTIEAGLVIASLIGTATMCLVKIITQLENSRCTTIKCCGVDCTRDVQTPVVEVSTEGTMRSTEPTIPAIPIIPPAPPVPIAAPIPRPRPTLSELRSRFES
jgi:hypothetical protein